MGRLKPSWDERYRQGYGAGLAPAPFVVEQLVWLPSEVALLDVAGGRGRHAIWAAQRGMDVTLVDGSSAALELAQRELPGLRTLQWDLEEHGLPPGAWDVLVVHHFLHRPLLAAAGDALQPGGLCIFVQPTTTNLERHPRPSRRFLVEPGEARGLFGELEIVVYDESWRDDRHEARVVARRRA